MNLTDMITLYDRVSAFLPGYDYEVILLLIIVAIVGIFVKYIKPMHVRYHLPVTASIVLLGLSLALILTILQNVGVWVFTLLGAANVILIAMLLYSIKRPLPISKLRLNQCRKVIDQLENLDLAKRSLFDKKPWYILTPVERFEFALLKSRFFFHTSDFKNTYLCLAEIDEAKLFPHEKKKLYIMQINSSINLGAMRKAETICKKLEAGSMDCDGYIMCSLLEDRKGNIDSSLEYLNRALYSVTVDTSVTTLAVLYNNLGRAYKLRNNLSEAAHYYRKGLELPTLKISKLQRHIFYQNLISTLYSTPSDPKGVAEAEKLYNQYIAENMNPTMQDSIELETFQLNLCRQFKTEHEMRALIVEGYRRLKQKAISEAPALLPNFIASNFRLYINYQINPEEIMNDIRTYWRIFFESKALNRYFTLKEIYSGMKRFNPNGYIREFQNEVSELENYMTYQALEDLDGSLRQFDDIEIYSRVNLLREKAVILKDFVKPYQFRHVHQVLNDVVDIYETNGLMIEAVNVRLDIADECIAIQNMSNGSTAYPGVMNEQVDLIGLQLASFRNHDTAATVELRLAFYCLCLGKKSDSKEYYERWQKHDISPLQYSDWVRRYLEILKHEHGEGCN